MVLFTFIVVWFITTVNKNSVYFHNDSTVKKKLENVHNGKNYDPWSASKNVHSNVYVVIVG